MRHYYANRKTADFRGKVLRYDDYKVLDTLDLTSELVRFKNFLPLFTEKFINAYYCKEDIDSMLKRRKRIKPTTVFPFKDDYVGTHFEFPIKDGYVKYDGNYLDIEFLGEKHKLWFAKTASYSVIFIFDNIICNYIRLIDPYCGLFINDIEVVGNMLILELFMSKSSTISIVFDYSAGTVCAEGISNGNKFVCQSLTDYCNDVCFSLEGFLKNNKSVNNSLSPFAMLSLLKEAFRRNDVDKEVFKRLIIVYKACKIKNLLNPKDNSLNHLCEDYDKTLGMPENIDTLVAKYLFMNNL